ncbi:MAG: NADH-quinone oxidoreductase subunit L [Yoonia sp.]|uniref:NADH-quinone oxidoreductase subunit L n=1 Tax=Yoonia sp. TaxID=2212373 RepID=UPI003EF5424C
MLLNALPLLAPLILLAAAFAPRHMQEVDARKGAWIAEIATLATIAVAVLSALVLIITGGGDSFLLGLFGIGFSVRLDVVSVVMLLLVTFIGWVVVRYARTYLDGEPRHDSFTFWLLATLSVVLLLVQSGNVVQFVFAWVATSMCLHQLLVFYPQRDAAQRAARKKFVLARIGDFALVGAAILLTICYGTTQISAMLAGAASGQGGGWTQGAAALIALAAILKSAQFPLHGWLTEVMEAPTPVSALLHAGVVNAGGFALIRFADVMLLAPLVLAILVIIGGFTALFAGLVMLTQPTVKASLAWSTIAQMGFMILQCGLALFPLALLHIVAHSAYKAHAFLSAGGAVEGVAAIRRPGPVAVPDLRAVTRAFVVALGIYAVIYAIIGFTLDIGGKSPQAVALGAILIFGVAYLLAQGFADEAPKALTQRTAAYAALATVSYLLLQRASEWLTAGALPATPPAGALEWALIILALLSFALVAVAQATLPLWSYHPAAQGLRVHLSNGFYINAVSDRLLGGWIKTTNKKEAAQ